MAQYLTKFQDLNNVVRLGGQTIKKIITRTVPKKLMELIYSCYAYNSLGRFKIYYHNTRYRFNLQISYIITKAPAGKPKKKARFETGAVKIRLILILIIIKRRNIRPIRLILKRE